eukprot:GHVL01034288.1.p1 GENE.GHVL01034288.1~~GHVL01034288.1.p1  ORF type:complete len:479 (+),score=59.84 GHVL01034288.1:237-1673(+)
MKQKFTFTIPEILAVGDYNVCACFVGLETTCAAPGTTTNTRNAYKSNIGQVAVTAASAMDIHCSLTVSCNYSTDAGADSYLIPKEASTDEPCTGNVVGEPIEASNGSFAVTAVTIPGIYDMCLCGEAACTTTTILGALKMGPAPIPNMTCQQNSECSATLVTDFSLHNVGDKAFLTTKACGSITDNDTIVIADEITDSTSMQVFTFTIPETLALGDYNICACFAGLETTCAAPGTTANTRNAYKSNIGQVAVTAASAMDIHCSLTVSCNYSTDAGANTYSIPKEASTLGPCMGTDVGTPIQASNGSFVVTAVTIPGIYDMCLCGEAACTTTTILGALKMGPAPIPNMTCQQNSECSATLVTDFSLHNVGDKAFLTTKACGSTTDSDTIVIAAAITTSASMQKFTFTIPETLALENYNICACFVGLETTCEAPGTTATTRNAYKSNIGQVAVTENAPTNSASAVAVSLLVVVTALFAQA